MAEEGKVEGQTLRILRRVYEYPREKPVNFLLISCQSANARVNAVVVDVDALARFEL